MKFKCTFGIHKRLETHQRFVIDEGFGSQCVMYGAYCPDCMSMWLEPSRGPEQWHPTDGIEKHEAESQLRIPNSNN